MSWNPQGGGPWGGGGNGNGGGNSPWGSGGGGRPPGGGPTPPDIEEMIRKSQDKFKRFMPSGGGGVRSIILILIVGVALWLGSGFYRVQPEQQGVVMLFGKYVQTTEPGLNWYFPSPIGTVLTPSVTSINQIQIGFRGEDNQVRGGSNRDVPQESLMLTGDQNIADVDFNVFWRVRDAGDFLFNIRDPEQTIKIAAESAMREVIGQSNLEEALTTGKKSIQDEVFERLQSILDEYKAGILITEVQLLKVDPPAQVIDAFNEVQRARQDKDRKLNEAETYRNRIVPTARGEAAQIVQEAEAYKEKVIKDAEGEAQRFIAIYESYKAARDVTEKRMYLEALEEVMTGTNKVIIDDKAQGGQGVVPYLPLNELNKSKGVTK